MEEVVWIKVSDIRNGDVIFEGKVSTDVAPDELLFLSCFWERGFCGLSNKATGKRLKSFKGLKNHAELVGTLGGYRRFSGVLYVRADDGVLRKSNCVPSCECVMVTVRKLSGEECEKAFKCETLEELDIHYCILTHIPSDIRKLKKLKRLRLYALDHLTNIPEEMGELSNLEDLWIGNCAIESLPKRLKELKKLKSIRLLFLNALQPHPDDLVVFSTLKCLLIRSCLKVLSPSFAHGFWDMIKSTTSLSLLHIDWIFQQNRATMTEALIENGSIVDGGVNSDKYAYVFKRNKANHERARECVVHLLAIKRWRNALNGVPKEMIQMLAMMLWMMRCDVGAWMKQ